MRTRNINPRVVLVALACGLFLAGCPLIPSEDDFDLDRDLDLDEFDTSALVNSAIIDTANGGCFEFQSGTENCDTPFLIFEPWCTALPGICGNWVETEFTNMDDVTEPPADGYISDLAGFEDCQEVNLNKVIVFKFEDGSHAKGIITNDEYTEGQYGCDHKITLEYIYPFI